MINTGELAVATPLHETEPTSSLPMGPGECARGRRCCIHRPAIPPAPTTSQFEPGFPDALNQRLQMLLLTRRRISSNKCRGFRCGDYEALVVTLKGVGTEFPGLRRVRTCSRDFRREDLEGLLQPGFNKAAVEVPFGCVRNGADPDQLLRCYITA